MTLDRRGEGEPTGDSSRGRLDLQAEDALAVIGAVDARRVGPWGISQGGTLAPEYRRTLLDWVVDQARRAD